MYSIVSFSCFLLSSSFRWLDNFNPGNDFLIPAVPLQNFSNLKISTREEFSSDNHSDVNPKPGVVQLGEKLQVITSGHATSEELA